MMIADEKKAVSASTRRNIARSGKIKESEGFCSQWF